MSAEKLIKASEGCRLKLYRDSTGRATIGWGRDLTDDGISDAEADTLFGNDLSTATADATEFVGMTSWVTLGPARQAAVTDLAFNLGLPELLEFRNMRAALRAGNWQGAHDECLKSVAAQQEYGRIARDAQIILTGIDPTEAKGDSP